MALPTQEEKIAIQKFRDRVGDVLTLEDLRNDWFLLRWLRDLGFDARDLNLDKAEGMLRTSMKWRMERKVDGTLSRPVDSYFSTNYPFHVNGKDRDGRPLLVLPLGKWDARLAVEDGRVEQLTDYMSFFFEKIMETIRKSRSSNPHHPHTQFTAIVDWDGYSFRQFTNIKAAQSILKLSSTYEAHYPEILHEAFFINCTSVFQMFFALMKKVLAEKTVGKIRVFGTNKKEWLPEIYKSVDPKEIHYDLKDGQEVKEEELRAMQIHSAN